MKPIGVQDVEMSDTTAHSSAAKTYKSHKTNDDSTTSLDKEIPAADDENLLPSPTTLEGNEIVGFMDEDTPKAFNLYRNKKLLSHGLMDVALFSANANQLRYVLESSDGGAFFVICVVLLLISIFLQILVGVALIVSARYNVTNYDQRKMAFKMGNYVIVGIFLITVVNVFITSFGGPSVIPPTIMTTPVTEVPDFIATGLV